MTMTQRWLTDFQNKYERSGQPIERFGRVMKAAAELDGVDLDDAERSDRHMPLIRCPGCGQVRAADEFETVGDEVREGIDRASDAQLTAALRRQSHGTFAKRREDDQTPVLVGQRYTDGRYESVYITRAEHNCRRQREAVASKRAQNRMEAAGETCGSKFSRYMEEEMEELDK